MTSTVSQEQANAPVPADCGYVQTAQRRVEAMRTAQRDDLPEPTPADLESVTGKKVRRLALRAQNWRNRVYTIEFEDGDLAIAKQLVMGSDAMLQYQYAQLQELAALKIAGLRTPKAMGLLPAKRVLVMEFAPGRNIESLAWTSSDVLRACDLAGKILARIQLARTQEIAPMPIELLRRDLDAAPWHLSRSEAQVLEKTFERLSRATVRMGQVYYDYKPANLLLDGNQLFLVDPPDTPWRGVHLWDFACFHSSMRRHGWRLGLRRPFDRGRRAILQQGIVAFERSYRATFTDRHPQPGFFQPAVRLFELQRNAVLTTMQNAKVELTRSRAAIAHGGRLGNPLANRMTLPLLQLEKRWLFRQLARDLS